MLLYKYSGDPNNRRFFIGELIEILKLEDLLKEAYILIKHCNLSYSDVKMLTRVERVAFLEFFKEEQRALEQVTK